MTASTFAGATAAPAGDRTSQAPAAGDRTPSGAAVPADRTRSVRGRVPVTVLALVGGVTATVGAFLPWIAAFAGLVTFAGVRGLNGRIVAVTGLLISVAALWYAVRGGPRLRLMIGLLGFALSTFVGYLIVGLVRTVSTTGPMVIARQENGLYVCAVGSLLVLSTLFLPGAQTRAAADATVDDRRVDLRWAAGIAAVVAALAHIPVTPVHLHQAPYIGVSFIVFTVLSLVGAAALSRTESPLVWRALLALNSGAIAIYVLSRSVALPQIGDDAGNWLEPLGVVAVAAEAIVCVTAIAALTTGRRRSNTATTAAAAA